MGLIIVILAVYIQTCNHQFLNFDDDSYVTNNPHVASGLTGKNIIWAFTSVDEANWHPITWLSHMADAQFYGMNPRGHHLTNVVIHTVSSLLLLLFLLRVTGSLWESSFVAFLFALHPMHVESVAWVAERKDVLSALFWFLTLLFYAEYTVKRKPTLYFLTLSSFVLGLMSKPMLVTLPAVMLLIDFWPLNRFQHEVQEPVPRQLWDRGIALVKEKIPFFVCALFSSFITIYAQHKGEAMSGLDALPLWLRTENALISYVKYISKALWPHDLAVFYPYPLHIPFWQVLSSLLVLSLVSAAAILGGRRHPYLPVGWFWFLVTLLPVIGFIQVGVQSMADRYSYIPLVGFFIMFAWGIPDLTKRLRCRKEILALVGGAVIVLSAALTWQQLGYWRDDISLYRHTLQVTTGNYVIHTNLGDDLAKKGDLDAAIQEFHEALNINHNYSLAHFNMGIALAKKGNLDAAISEYKEALRISPNDPYAHDSLGTALADKGNMDEAIQEYKEALKLNPNFSLAHYNMGTTLAERGNLDEAIQEYQEALEIDPNDPKSHNSLGITLADEGNLDAAILEFQKAIRINANYADAHRNLGVALGEKGNIGAAIQEYQEVLRINPNNPELRNTLINLYKLKRDQDNNRK
jgi:tetratricopeptide (TPR) repeat protein